MDIFYPGGNALGIGDLLVQADLARTFRRMIDAERAAAGQGRETGIRAARDLFYKGDIAEEMVAFIRSQGGWLSMSDLASFSVGVDTPPMIDYKGIDVYACGPWCQGPMSLHALRILEGCDLQGMGHNSADYIHTVLEALKLAFADRHAYYGDPDFVDVPMAGLLSREYAEIRRKEIDPRRAHPEMPDAGDPWAFQSGSGHAARKPEPVAGPLSAEHLVHLRRGPLGQRLLRHPQRRLWRRAHRARSGLHGVRSRSAELAGRGPSPPALRPESAHASPRIRRWRSRMASPGCPSERRAATCNPQSMVQLFLNVAEFGMDVQQAIEAPRASTWSFPNSFWPHAYRPGLVGVESRIEPSVVDDLRKRGHDVDVWNEWTPRMGSLCAIEIDRERGSLFGGADLRGMATRWAGKSQTHHI